MSVTFHPYRKRRRIKRLCAYQPLVEILEDRTAPAVYTWTGAALGNNNWSDEDNWQDQNQGVGVPGQNDIARFTGNAALVGIVDAAYSGTVGGIDTAANFGGAIELRRSLTVVGNSLHSGGSIRGQHQLTVAAGAQFDWAGVF